MDKRSFNFLFALLAISMIAMVTYKIKRKLNQSAVAIVKVDNKVRN